LDFVTFESEFVDTERVKRCLSGKTTVFPKLEVIEAIQDRLTQKRLLDRFKIVTSPWMPVESKADLKKAGERFTKGLVLKQRRFGYDGYGTFVFKKGVTAEAYAALEKSKFGFIAEAYVDFNRELALSLARSRNGDFVTLPLVESVQKDARCFSVRGPLPIGPAKGMAAAFKKMLKSLDYHGIMAVELFATSRGLMVNELAPRVHNSAHYSLDALACSQFEYHIRAGMGLKLPKVEVLRPGFAMVNLLGEEGKNIHLSLSPAGKLHWYGKSENRLGRKLGHINVLDTSSMKALKRALKWRKEFKL
jgi:5-(carboxyamino)imidazole ribonucleotide synthase